MILHLHDFKGCYDYQILVPGAYLKTKMSYQYRDPRVKDIFNMGNPIPENIIYNIIWQVSKFISYKPH